MSAHDSVAVHTPYAVLGAGVLTSCLQREDEGRQKRYRFNLFRTHIDGQVTHRLRPEDLPSIVKVCQVLAFTIADDGWVDDGQRRRLFELAESLDGITRTWDELDDGC